MVNLMVKEKKSFSQNYWRINLKMTENLNIPSDDNLKNFNKIIGTLENSLKIDPKDHNLYISLGDEYLKLKKI